MNKRQRQRSERQSNFLKSRVPKPFRTAARKRGRTLSNRTHTYSFLYFNARNRVRSIRPRRPSSSVSNFRLSTLLDSLPSQIRRFTNRRIPTKGQAKSDARPSQTNSRTRERCAHPWDEAAAAAVRTPARRFSSPRSTRVRVRPAIECRVRRVSRRTNSGIAPASDRRRAGETDAASRSPHWRRFRRDWRRGVDVDRWEHFGDVYSACVR